MRSGFKDLHSKRFNNLTVIQFVETKHERSYWLCRCDCGNTSTVRTDALTSGRTKSCGCLAKKTQLTGGVVTHGKSQSATYKSWASMKERCLNENADNYMHYGGRGIGICERWIDSFEAFLSDMGERPKGTTLDRIDNNGDYEPGNCRWQSVKSQARNRRNNRLLTKGDETHCLSEWSERTGIPYGTINSRLNRGWSVERALTTPARKMRVTAHV